MSVKKLSFILALLIIFSSQVSMARDQIRAVGSSTVYPFVTVVAENYGHSTDFKTPVVESTGTGGGFKLFCSGVGVDFPDLSNASRAIKNTERTLCKSNGITAITEIKIGYDGIVLANSIASKHYNLTKHQIFLALAKQIPLKGRLVENPYQNWSDIDSDLPNTKIEVYGPPPTSGTRDAFVELVLEDACKDLPAFKAAYPDKKQRKKQCHLIREDGRFIEAGENDNLIVQKLSANANSLGIFGYSFLDQNNSVVQASLIEGVEPNFENISNGSYSVSRPLFVYLKNNHIGIIPGLKEFVSELISDEAVGDEGYLTFKGLIPLSEDELSKVQSSISQL